VSYDDHMKTIALCVLLGLTACGSLQASAAKDPMRCERDPKCKDKQKAFDCSAQCSDDPACVERCTEIQAATGASAPH
jgi:hypothetical protein